MCVWGSHISALENITLSTLKQQFSCFQLKTSTNNGQTQKYIYIFMCVHTYIYKYIVCVCVSVRYVYCVAMIMCVHIETDSHRRRNIQHQLILYWIESCESCTRWTLKAHNRTMEEWLES